MKVCVVGSGLGGLLSAALLSEKGYKVEVFERLPFIGGRFTSLPYRGYEISTGALHMIPHGNRGHLAKLLKIAGAKVEIVNSKPESEILYNGEFIPVSRKTFPFKSRFLFLINYLKSKFKDVNLADFEKSLDELSGGFLRAFLGWSLSITPEQTTMSKIYPIYKSTLKLRGPGIPVGGCKAVVESLLEVIKSNDGVVKTRCGVSRIKKENYGFSVHFGEGKAERSKAFKAKRFDVVISNLGHEMTAKIAGIGGYVRCKPSSGIKYSIALKKPFIGHTGVLFTLGTRRISGLNEVTNADPNLGKEHFLMAHQPMITSNVKFEISEGLKDLKELLKGYEYEILVIQSFSDGWPVNRAMAGYDFGVETPVKGLYVVGDGAKGQDIEVEGVALGVEKVVRAIEG